MIIASILSALAMSTNATVTTVAPCEPLTNATAIVTNATAVVVEKQAEPAANATAAVTNAVAGRPARITSERTYYDRKGGIAVFDGRVHVDDEQYQLHADKVYVFMEGTNELRRITALGHVAMTNEARRAYGAKVNYYRRNGLVVLQAGDGIAAEVRDESRGEDAAQSVKGAKIKFWIDSEQVEVVEADISAPAKGGLGDLKGAIGR